MTEKNHLRIAQLIDSLEAGGAERMAVNYANALVDRIAFSGLVVTRKEGGLKDFKKNAVSYLFLGKKNNTDIVAFQKLRNYCVVHKITHLQAHSSSYFWATLIKVTLPHIKIIWHDHYGDSEFLNKRPVIMLKLCSFFMSLIISVNEKLRSWDASTLNCEKVVYLNNFPEINETTLPQNILKGNEGKRIVCLANLRPQKNHTLLIELASQLKKHYPDWSFHLVGKDFKDAYSNTIQNKIKALGLENYVYVYGSVEDIASVIYQAAFGILTSFSEGLPVSILEYGIMKKTVIASNVGDIGKVLIDRKTGILIDNFETESFYEGVKLMIEDVKIREMLAKNLNEHVNHHFSEDSILQKYLQELN